MHSEIRVAKKILGINGTIKQQEAEKEDRHYDHMEKLGYKTSESCWKIAHFCHILGVTKLQNIFICHK